MPSLGRENTLSGLKSTRYIAEAHEILSFYTTGSPFLSLFVLIGIVKANEVAKKQKERKERRKNLANKRNHYPPYT